MNGKYNKVKYAKKGMMFSLVLLTTIAAAYSQPVDSLKRTPQDTLSKSTSPLPDSLKQKDTTAAKNDTLKTPDTSKTIVKQGATDKQPLPDLQTTTPSDSDTTINLNGTFLGVRAGWTIGNFDLVKQWQEALPASLENFNISKDFYIIKDSTHTSPYIDTTDLKYVIKELPGAYNISIPVGLQFTKISEQKKTSVLLSFAYVGKTQKSVITGSIDSLSESVNIRSNLNTFSFFLEGNYSIPFPEQYFKIDGVDKNFFTLGVSLSTIIVRVGNDISFGGKSSRMDSVKSAISNILADKSSVGAAVSLRAGVSTIRALSKTSILEFGVSYLLSRYDYFYKDNQRLNKEWIQPGVKDSNKPLAFFSNRIEFTVGIFRRVPK
jgi:hypothetical protein